MIVDAHCHLTGGYQKDKDVDGILGRAKAAGVIGAVAVGTDLEDSKKVIELAENYSSIRASLGVHPHDAKTWCVETEMELRSLLKSPLALFVGETGLDWHYDLSPRDLQENAFRAQIRLAIEIGKPLMVHTRSAPDATLAILEEEGASKVGGVIHCFTEDPPFAQRAVGLGFYISFSGIITFPKNSLAIREAAAWVPEDRILVETDAPFLAPAPHRGKQNEPAFVVHTARHLAELRGCSEKHIQDITCKNLRTLTGWDVAQC
jgi:TatD DNase family protein